MIHSISPVKKNNVLSNLERFFTSNLFETCFMVANDDLKGKTTHFKGFYIHTISEPKLLKPTQGVTQRDSIATAILNT